MILKLRDTANIRSFLDTRTGDVILQADPTNGFTGDYSYHGYWEVIARGSIAVDRRVDALHINHKKGVVRVLKGYTEEEVDGLLDRRDEECLDCIISDYANAHIREPDKEQDDKPLG